MASRSFATEIRKCREASEKPLRLMAEALGGVSIAYASDIEKGRRHPPSPELIAELARLYGCENRTDELIDLALQQRGSITFKPTSSDSRGLLIALNKNLDQLDAERVQEIRKILDGESTD